MEPLFLNAPAQRPRPQGRQARVAARAADQPAQGRSSLMLERDTPRDRGLARALRRCRRCIAPSASIVIAVNDDIDPDNADALLWAMSYRCNPHARRAASCSTATRATARAASATAAGRLGADRRHAEGRLPADLAAQAGVHGAARRRSGRSWACPRCKPQAPWFGYSLGDWSPRSRRGGRARDARRLSRQRPGPGAPPPQGRAHEHRSAQRQGNRAETKRKPKR